MIARLFTGIFGILGVALGIPFLLVGLLGPSEFIPIAIPVLVAGLVLLGICTLLFRREAALSARRRAGARVRAEVVDARLKPYVRVGVMQTVDLTVRIPSTPGVHTRRVLLPPAVAVGPGDEIEVFVDPEDPANFEPVVTAEHRLR